MKYIDGFPSQAIEHYNALTFKLMEVRSIEWEMISVSPVAGITRTGHAATEA
jgi:hypothetical protein